MFIFANCNEFELMNEERSMIKKKILLLFIPILLLCGCKFNRSNSEESSTLITFESMSTPQYKVQNDKVRARLLELCASAGTSSVRGTALSEYYSSKESFLWMTTYGEWSRIDTLIHRLEQSKIHGLNPERFSLSKIKSDFKKLKNLNTEKKVNINNLLAEFEYKLSSAYLRYVCGLSYGFVNPRKVLNNIDEEERAPNDTIETQKRKRMKVYYAVPLKRCDSEFISKALEAPNNDLDLFLEEVQPKDPFYLEMQKEYLRLTQSGADGKRSSKATINKLAANMERMRWHKKLEKGGKYVEVNLANFTLKAVDQSVDSVLEMKVCCGSYANKTPLLASTIRYMQLNPYWTVPKSIIRKEIVPSLIKDPTYLEKHQMKVYDKVGNEVDPLTINWSEYKGDIPFAIKQEKGEGNSLGRLIFRFTNDFAVYLHDTSSRKSFAKGNRAVSHGCVRLERPLDLAFFLLNDKDELLMDKVRMAIDIPPQTEEGKELLESATYKPMKNLNFPEAVPLFLDYYTVYLSNKGQLNYCEDVYQFDTVLLKELNKE